MKQKIFAILKAIYRFTIPNRKDTIKRNVFKIGFIVSLIAVIVSLSLLSAPVSETIHQKTIVDESRRIWYDNSEKNAKSRWEIMTDENPDFRGWIYVKGTSIENPFYQTDNDSYYLSYNQRKEKSASGAIFLSCKDDINKSDTDRNLTIFGHLTKDNGMFKTLTRFRKIAFYKENPTINLTTRYRDDVYKVFAVIVLNSNPEDDNGYVFDITREEFYGSDDFNSWVDESKQRSLIKTDIDVSYGDSILSLVTCCYDIKNARLVVMSRRTRANESPSVDTSKAVTNPSPRYPKKWYDEHKKKYPY